MRAKLLLVQAGWEANIHMINFDEVRGAGGWGEASGGSRSPVARGVHGGLRGLAGSGCTCLSALAALIREASAMAIDIAA